MNDIVEAVAAEIADIPGKPTTSEIARVAIEAYQRALWPNHFALLTPMYPQHRQQRAHAMTAHIMNIVGKYLCDHGEAHGPRDASRELFEAIYESGAEIITDADRVAAGLPARGPYGLTREQLKILDARYTQALLAPMPPFVMPKDYHT